MGALASVRRYTIGSFLTLFACGCVPTLSLSDFESVPLRKPLHRYAVAHRGSLHEGLPDNSLPALQQAISKGARFLEVDVRQGADGELFLFHDGSLQESNYSSPKELLGKRVQELSTSDRGKVRLDPAGLIGIPTLKAALATLDTSETATLQIDMKGESDQLLDAVVKVFKEENKVARAIIQLKNPERIKRIRLQEPAIRVLARARDMSQLDQAIASKVEFIELERWITGEAVEKCHAANITVVLNVAAPRYDKKETWEFFRARGVDSIMTDHAVVAVQE
jgi:glycerophosphoryl diester phosphodiesterase